LKNIAATANHKPLKRSNPAYRKVRARITPLTAPSLPFQRAGTARNKKHTDLACQQGLYAEQVAFTAAVRTSRSYCLKLSHHQKTPLCNGVRERARLGAKMTPVGLPMQKKMYQWAYQQQRQQYECPN
jgi:hypothetical protein